MIPDHQSPAVMNSQAVRFQRKTGFEANAGTQALHRADRFEITTASGESIVLRAPDAIGALVIKGAAHIADTRDRGRHLEDAAVLLACLGSVSQVAASTFSKNDRRRLRHLDAILSNPAHDAWLSLPETSRKLGLARLAFLRRAAEL